MKRFVLISVFLVTIFTLGGCADETTEVSVSTVPPQLTESAALAETQALADAGDAEAQFKLGNVYAAGIEVPNDFTEAAKWFRKAGDQGHAEALYFLGVIYANGFGAPVDFTEAYALFCLSAKFGFETATDDCDNLSGELSPEDLDLANNRIEELYEEIQLRE